MRTIWRRIGNDSLQGTPPQASGRGRHQGAEMMSGEFDQQRCGS